MGLSFPWIICVKWWITSECRNSNKTYLGVNWTVKFLLFRFVISYVHIPDFSVSLILKYYENVVLWGNWLRIRDRFCYCHLVQLFYLTLFAMFVLKILVKYPFFFFFNNIYKCFLHWKVVCTVDLSDQYTRVLYENSLSIGKILFRVWTNIFRDFYF